MVDQGRDGQRLCMNFKIILKLIPGAVKTIQNKGLRTSLITLFFFDKTEKFDTILIFCLGTITRFYTQLKVNSCFRDLSCRQ